MKFKKRISTVIVLGALISSSISISIVNTVQAVGGVDNKTYDSQAENSRNVDQQWAYGNGLYGYYFYGTDANNIAFIDGTGMEDLSLDSSRFDELNFKKEVQSARWYRTFTSEKDGYYIFSTSDPLHSVIELNQKVISNYQTASNPIFIKKGQPYRLIVEYSGNNDVTFENICDINLIITEENNQKTSESSVSEITKSQISTIDLSTVDVTKKISTLSNTDTLNNKNVPLEDIQNNSINDEEPWPDDRDSDGDGIVDQWEVEGYCIYRGVIYYYDDEIFSNNNKRGKIYKSNPLLSHTTGDPYTDVEHVTFYLDRSMDQAVRDPMVAAAPCIAVKMEDLIISRNQQFTQEEGTTKSIETGSTTSNTWGASNTVGASFSLEFSMLKGLGGSTSANFSRSWSNSSTQEVRSSSSTGSNFGTSLSIDQGHSAYLNANIRYYNTGTAPIYNVFPTTNLVLDNKTIATIKAQENQEALGLAPIDTYPSLQHHAIALNTLDLFSNSPITVNYDQLTQLDNGKPLLLETTQAQGNFSTVHPYDNGLLLIEGNNWSSYLPGINTVTSTFVFDDGRGTSVTKQIAAYSGKNHDYTPTLTFQEALYKLYDVYDENDEIAFEVHDNKYYLRTSDFRLSMDDFTAQKIKSQLEKNPELDLSDVIVEPKMKFLIVLYPDIASMRYNETISIDLSTLPTLNDLQDVSYDSQKKLLTIENNKYQNKYVITGRATDLKIEIKADDTNLTLNDVTMTNENMGDVSMINFSGKNPILNIMNKNSLKNLMLTSKSGIIYGENLKITGPGELSLDGYGMNATDNYTGTIFSSKFIKHYTDSAGRTKYQFFGHSSGSEIFSDSTLYIDNNKPLSLSSLNTYSHRMLLMNPPIGMNYHINFYRDPVVLYYLYNLAF